MYVLLSRQIASAHSTNVHARSILPSCIATKKPVAGPSRVQDSIDPRSSLRPRFLLNQWDTKIRSGPLNRASAPQDKNTLICASTCYSSDSTSLEILPLHTSLRILPSILIHAPYGGKEARLGSWRALVEAQKAGKTRSIGVSNYGIHHLEELEEYIQNGSGGEISVGQYELHPWLDHSDIAEWCQSRGIVVEAYSPLAHGTRFREPVLRTIGEKYNKSPAQVLIRWSLQMVSCAWGARYDKAYECRVANLGDFVRDSCHSQNL